MPGIFKYARYMFFAWLALQPVVYVAIPHSIHSISKRFVGDISTMFLSATLQESDMLLAENIVHTIIGDSRRPPPLENILIRPAVQNELLSVSSLRVSVFYPDVMTNGAFHSKILDKLRTRREEGSILLVALEDEVLTAPRPAGFRQPFLLGTVEFSSSNFRNTTMEAVGSSRKLYIMDLAIRKCARRLGLATRLLDSIEDYARNHEYKELYLHVEKSNIPALYLYRKSGFVVIEPTTHTDEFTRSQLPNPPEVYELLWKQLL